MTEEPSLSPVNRCYQDSVRLVSTGNSTEKQKKRTHNDASLLDSDRPTPCDVKCFKVALKGLKSSSDRQVFTCSAAAQRHVGGIKPATAELQNSRPLTRLTATGSKTKRGRKGKGHTSDAAGHLQAGLHLRPPVRPSTRPSVDKVGGCCWDHGSSLTRPPRS